MLAALVLLGVFALVVGWEILCLAEVVRADRVRLLPRWVWAVACLLMIPFGGIAYLLIGRVWGHGPGGTDRGRRRIAPAAARGGSSRPGSAVRPW